MAILDLLVLTSLSDSESVNIKYFQVINKGRRQKKKCIFHGQLTITEAILQKIPEFYEILS